MLEEWQPVKLCGYWQVQFLTKLAHASKDTCQFGGLGIEARGTNCPKLTGV